jgi:hypothetical protein
MHATIRSRIFCPLACCKKNVKVRIYKTITLPVVLYGCETWFLTVGEEHKLRVFENRMLRIFGPNRDRDSFYSSPSILRIIKSRRMRWADMWHEWERRGTCIGYW